MTPVRRTRPRFRRRQPKPAMRLAITPFTAIASTLERLADDGATLCDCADGRRCVA